MNADGAYSLIIQDRAKGLGVPVERKLRYYLLEEERLPSGQYIIYQHFEEGEFISLALLDSRKKKRYAQIDLSVSPSGTTLFSKRGRVASYSFFSSKEREYLEKVALFGHPEHFFTYKETKKKACALLESMYVGSIKELQVQYNEEYKVESIERPIGKVAHFLYETHYTDVRDSQGVLTRYHHNDEQLEYIEYFDEEERLVSSQQFFWSNGYLIGKAMCNDEGRALFSKTFIYDSFGNVIEEVLYGNLSGGCAAFFEIDETGRLLEAEKYRKIYRYDPFTHLLIEEEDKGLLYRYRYKKGTDLLTSKETYFETALLRRENFLYDEENLLIETSVDDGYFSQFVYFENDETTGLCKARHERGLKRSEYERGLDGQIVKETVYDSDGAYSYTLYIQYDEAGRVLSKTTPCGLKNIYIYDDYGYLIESKEVGSPRNYFFYDEMHRCIHAKQEGKISEIAYDAKGNVCLEKDFKGLERYHQYDCFGRKIRTSIPSVGQEISYLYDLQGNIIQKRSPKGYVTKSTYTTLQKPVLLIAPDGAVTKHSYTLSGLIRSTVQPDQTCIVYEYDALDRMIAKKIYDATFKLIAEENWRYKGSLLDSYIERSGVETLYTYDSYGRCIQENKGGRITSYTYDRFGFIKTREIGGVVYTQIHDAEGRVVEEVTEGEDHTWYRFNEEGQKVAVEMLTSSGKAIDLFTYDPVGRVLSHTSPTKAVTYIQYEDFSKTTIDPLGLIAIERYDLLSRKIEVEKKDKEGNTLFLEQFTYDLEGNVTFQKSSVYEKGTLQKELELSFIYDAMGRIVHQIEGGERRTSYRYDAKGRNIAHTKPDGITLYRTYDGLDRITSLKTRDRSIFYDYTYDLYDQPIKIEDRASGCTLAFSYNPFSEVVQEGDLSWQYDDLGRVTAFILPDRSSIGYAYEGLHMRSIDRIDQEGNVLYTHRYTDFDLNGHVEKEEMIASLGTVVTKRDLLQSPTFITSSYAQEKIAYNRIGLITLKEHSLLPKKEYAYDPLYQLTQEGEERYHFDALGRRLDDEVDEYNQVISRGSSGFSYDLNGNLIRESIEGAIREYEYDALDRVVSITTPGKRKVLYAYDPLSRLFSKEIFSYERGEYRLVEKKRYLYNKEVEIGSIHEDGSLCDLKILGLGIQGEVGAAVALEIEGYLYAPLHDVNGHIIALVDANSQTIEEIYEINAFGQEIKDLYRSPWRFSSKREEEGLVFFGCRFYHPELGRWVTPDPLGFKESRNPYLFVLNTPVNRLDLFGLLSMPNFYFESKGDRYYGVLQQTTTPIPSTLINSPEFRKVHTNIICIHDHAHILQFSPEEMAAGQFNLLHHLDQIIPPQGGKVGMALYGNGMNTDQECWKNTCFSIASLLPEGPVLLSLHNPTSGLFKDFMRIFRTFQGQDQEQVQLLRELHIALLTDIHTRNEEASILNFVYSEGALNYFAEFQGMTEGEQKLLRSHFLVHTIGSPRFSPKDFGKKCVNYFSDKDYIAKIPGRKYFYDNDYEIKQVNCMSKRSEMTAGFIDHAILAPTYMGVMKHIIQNTEENYGFYTKNNR